MAVEARRGCGYRKVGGLYMMGGALSAPCCKMPIIMDVCPCCSQGVRLTRTWTWLDPREWLRVKECTSQPSQAFKTAGNPLLCPLADTSGEGLRAMSDRESGTKVRVGLLNVGAQFYPTPEHFLVEARAMGLSRRIQAVPRGFRVGEHWVWVAHPKVRQVPDEEVPGGSRWVGGVIAMFRPDRIEKVMTESQAAALTGEEREAMGARGISPFVVPDGDKDHQGSVYEDAGSE